MRRGAVCGLLIGLAGTALTLFGPARPAAAEGTTGVQVFGLSQRDSDGDGQPDVAIIDCSFATASDRVYVYDGGNDMPVGEDWQVVTDFVNDTWLFDVEGNDSIQLVLRFAQEDGRSVAYFYDDLNGDGQVAYQQPEGAESAYWTLKVESDGDWRLPNGSPNLNLRFLTDGYLQETAASMPASYIATLKRDGQVDLESNVVDANHDGAPEYTAGGLVAPSDPGDALFRSGMRVNAGGRAPAPPEGYVFWPFLGGADWYKRRNYFDSVPFVSVDWAKARLLGANLAGYPIESGYSINTFQYWRPGQVNEADFENPMAYYDLAGDQDGRPELHIRLEYYGPDDPYLLGGAAPIPIEDVRYSWNQRNSPDLFWDYKLGLAGINPVDSVVWVGDWGVRSVPYETLPEWVTGHTWEWGTLVAQEGGGYASSEGIYEWASMGNVIVNASPAPGAGPVFAGARDSLNQYLAGKTVLSPGVYYQQIRRGLRGEFAVLHAQPFLYFSPIDARLHLVGATQGVWNVDGSAAVYYANLDGDSYLDEWRYVGGGETRQLVAAPDYLLYADGDGVTLKRVRVQPALFKVLPPRNQAEWGALDAQLKANHRDLVPGDLAAMLAQFDGPATVIRGAAVRDFRFTDQGSRFVLRLWPGAQVISDSDGLSSTLSAPFAYLVTYNGGFSARPLRPVALRLSSFQFGAAGQPVRELEWVTVQAVVRNDGLEDALDFPLCIALQGPDGRREALTTRISLLPGESSQPVTWSWAPSAAGTWNAVLDDCTGDPDPRRRFGATSVTVERQPALPLQWLLSLGYRVRQWVIVLLVSAAVMASSIAALWTFDVGRRQTAGGAARPDAGEDDGPW